MLSPPLSSTSDAIENVEHTARDGIQSGKAVDAGSSAPPGSGLVGRRSKARVQCTWKDCDHQEREVDEMK